MVGFVIGIVVVFSRQGEIKVQGRKWTADEIKAAAACADKAIEVAMNEPEMTDEEQLLYDSKKGYTYDEDNDPYGLNRF